jgi:hypothetical protein
MIPVIDFDIYANLIMPLNHRLKETLLYVRATLYSVKRLYEIFTLYKSGSGCDWYDSGAAYPLGYRVKTIFGVYESLVDGNTGNATTDTTKWQQILDSYIGIEERVRYCSNKIVYEYALNRWFGTVFQQYTDTAYTHVSDIYITTAEPTYPTFVVGLTTGDAVGLTESTGWVSSTPIYTSASTYKFNIYVPTIVYNALGTTTDIREKTFRGFADRLKPSGTTYNIILY